MIFGGKHYIYLLMLYSISADLTACYIRCVSKVRKNFMTGHGFEPPSKLYKIQFIASLKLSLCILFVLMGHAIAKPKN